MREGANDDVVLIVPVVSWVLGVLWLDHSLVIGSLSRYIQTAWIWTPSREKGGRWFPPAWAATSWTVVMSSFVAPSAAALLLVSPGEVDHDLRAVWWAGLALTVVFAVAFVAARVAKRLHHGDHPSGQM